MRAISLAFGLTLLSSAFGCSHTTQNDDDAAASESASACRKEAEAFCTREYKPTRCVFDKQEFSSSNPCEAKKLVKAYACENNVKYSDEQVKCDSHNSIHMKNDDAYQKPHGSAQ